MLGGRMCTYYYIGEVYVTSAYQVGGTVIDDIK